MKRNRWDDYYARRARDEKWLARSIYKLQEIDEKFKLIQKGGRLLDLGCYPGSWSQYGIKNAGLHGDVVGIDVNFPNRLSSPNFRFIQSDVLTARLDLLAGEIGPRDLVLSDLAPQTTGIRATDAGRSMLLTHRAAEFALLLLKKKGNFVCKVFENEDLTPFKAKLSRYFLKIRLFRARATRKKSREVYLVGLGFL
ncbi:MAG: hypothetical protein B1H11_02045 [Desulfobacteraceae bacterium 4484_190.1]|nr:MAG: hypothetical protein B1H11_02045 [Desulfobacteraceae bacterium 4484_190.1]